MAAASLPLIDVDRLQLGMYVVLDVGWRNHPFLRSNFTVRTQAQLNELRGLGLQQVRYCPERSTAGPLPEPEPIASEIVETAAANEIARASVERVLPKDQDWPQVALQRIENEFSQIAQAHQQMLQQLANEPAEARETAEALSDTLYRSVAGCAQPTVRLLSQRVAALASGHEVGTSALALLLARECRFSEEAQQELGLAALLHDVGKTRMPGLLHEDNGRLTEAERRSYRQHVVLGVDLARSMHLPVAVTRAIAEHHEHCDGSGFPVGMPGEHLSEISRVLAIVNRYMNLVCPQRLDAGLTPYQALQQMYGPERAHFDANLLSRFVRILGVYPPGTLVELTDQRIAIVISARRGASLAPRVQIIERPDGDETGPTVDIRSDGELRVRRPLPPEQLNARWAYRSRQFARTPIYIEPQAAPEWAAWSAPAAGQGAEY